MCHIACNCKLCACHVQVKEIHKNMCKKYMEILHSACEILLAEFRVKEDRVFTAEHQLLAKVVIIKWLFLAEKCCMSNSTAGF